MKTYKYIVDFFVDVQTSGRHCHKNIKADTYKRIYSPSHFQQKVLVFPKRSQKFCKDVSVIFWALTQSLSVTTRVD